MAKTDRATELVLSDQEPTAKSCACAATNAIICRRKIVGPPLAPEGERDLNEIAAHIAKDNPAAAEKFGIRLLDRVEILKAFLPRAAIYAKDIQMCCAPTVDELEKLDAHHAANRVRRAVFRASLGLPVYPSERISC